MIKKMSQRNRLPEKILLRALVESIQHGGSIKQRIAYQRGALSEARKAAKLVEFLRKIRKDMPAAVVKAINKVLKEYNQQP